MTPFLSIACSTPQPSPLHPMPKPAPPATLHVNPATSSSYMKRDLGTAPEAFKASLEIMFCHMGDMFDIVLTVLSEKYGHSKEEMLATLVAHPSYQSLPRHPVLDSLGYFEEADLHRTFATATSSTLAPAPAPAITATATENPSKKVVVRRKKLKVTTDTT
jgi:hypothetical protein